MVKILMKRFLSKLIYLFHLINMDTKLFKISNLLILMKMNIKINNKIIILIKRKLIYFKKKVKKYYKKMLLLYKLINKNKILQNKIKNRHKKMIKMNNLHKDNNMKIMKKINHKKIKITQFI